MTAHATLAPIRAAGSRSGASLLLALAAVLIALLPDAAELLQYDAANNTQAWRWLTGHLTHWSFEHLLWDVLAFGVLALLAERESRGAMLACCIGSALAISAALAWGMPDIGQYRGLSGVDSALFVLVAVQAWRRGERGWKIAAAAALLAFAGKLGFEIATGHTLFVSQWSPDVAPLPLVHAIGGTVGAAVGVAWKPGDGNPRASR